MRKLDRYEPGKPVCKDIIAKRNDTFCWEITGFNKDGTPFDFDNKTFLLQVKEDEDDENTLLEISNSSFYLSQNAVGADAGIFNILKIIHPKEEMNVSFEDKFYDLQFTEVGSNGGRFTFYEGKFTVTKDVSRLII